MSGLKLAWQAWQIFRHPRIDFDEEARHARDYILNLTEFKGHPFWDHLARMPEADWRLLWRSSNANSDEQHFIEIVERLKTMRDRYHDQPLTAVVW